MLSVFDYKPGSELPALGLGQLSLLALLLVPGVLYLLTVQRAFARISPEHREMEPSKVWLLLIPVFGLIWHFLVVIKLTKSFRKTYEAQGIEIKDPSFGMLWGMLFGVVFLLVILSPVMSMVYPALRYIELLMGAVFLIVGGIWWAKLVAYSRKMA